MGNLESTLSLAKCQTTAAYSINQVRPRQEALQCQRWQHRTCNTGKNFFFNFD